MKVVLGYSILELLIVFCILTLLSFFSVQGYELYRKIQLESTSIAFYDSLQLAKGLAAKHNQIIFICPTNNGQDCSSKWQGSYRISLQGSSQTFFINPIPKDIHIESNIGAMIAFQPKGHPIRFGTIVLSNNKDSQKIVINQSGRIRRA